MARILTEEQDLAAIVRTMRTVAVVGMKDESRADEPAHGIPRMLHERGVRVIPVNPTIRASLGEPSRPNLAAVEERVDVLDVFRRSEAVPALADEVLALPPDRRPAVVWMQTGIRHDDAAARLVAAGIDVVMDACLGVVAARHRPTPHRGA
jgi:hypothetical protein